MSSPHSFRWYPGLTLVIITTPSASPPMGCLIPSRITVTAHRTGLHIVGSYFQHGNHTAASWRWNFLYTVSCTCWAESGRTEPAGMNEGDQFPAYSVFYGAAATQGMTPPICCWDLTDQPIGDGLLWRHVTAHQNKPLQVLKETKTFCANVDSINHKK